MKYIVTPPKHINSRIPLPASKSISNRALIIHALAGGSVKPRNLSNCDDTEVIIRALQDNPEVIDIRAAGTAMRFMTAYLSVTPGEHTLTGTERMKHRPIGVLVDALQRLGADIQYLGEEGFPPLRIKGHRLEGGCLEVPGNISSQFISALLMIGPTMQKGLQLKLTGDIVSRPYIDLTLHVMHDYDCQVDWTDVDTISVEPQKYLDHEYTIENDWSAASYWYETLALLADRESHVVLPGLMDSSRQGDSAVKYLFSVLGVKTDFASTDEGRLTDVKLSYRGTMLPRLEYDFINQPDLAQTMIAVCPVMGIHFRFSGLASLKIKETNRIEAMEREMRKLGYVINDVDGNYMSWEGERVDADEDPVIDTYEDHRMAMSFAPLAIKLGKITINNPEVVSKSYPHYWDDLRRAGFNITEA